MAQCPASNESDLLVIIIGAGISGLLLAQEFRKSGVSFRIFERDHDLSTRGAGWGLTLQWSLPALRELLPEDLLARLRDAYVDRVGVEQGESSRFPFYDLSTGELKGVGPGKSCMYELNMRQTLTSYLHLCRTAGRFSNTCDERKAA